MEYKTYKVGDKIRDNLEIFATNTQGGLGMIYFCNCKERKIKTVVKTISENLWMRTADSGKEVFEDLVTYAGKASKRGEITLEEYLSLIFIREARLLCRFQAHQNILRGFNFWIDKEHAQPYLECEYLAHSQNLLELVEKRVSEKGKGLSQLQVLNIAVAFCNGMYYLQHEVPEEYNLTEKVRMKGFIHRDIKPNNIMINRKNRIKIIDFGLAKFIFDVDEGFPGSATYLMEQASTMMVGQPLLIISSFSAPEQRAGGLGEATVQSDIYAFGHTLFYLLKGVKYNPLSSINYQYIEMIPELRGVLQKCMNDIPEMRYDTFEEIKRDLVNIIRSIKDGRNRIETHLRCESCGYVPNIQSSAGFASNGGIPPGVNGHEFVHIPKGEFQKGLTSNQEKKLRQEFSLQPLDASAQSVMIDDFELSRYPVTNEQYHAFLKESGYKNWPHGWNQSADPPYSAEKMDHPVVNVSCDDAEAYCKHYGLRLPTGDEWEKAARGTDGRLYPWGEDFDPGKVNSLESSASGTIPVTEKSGGDSPYGMRQMVGNVLEWLDEPHPQSNQYHYLCGGAWKTDGQVYGLPALRVFAAPKSLGYDQNLKEAVGFRPARDHKKKQPASSPTIDIDETCPLCGGHFIHFDPSEILVPGKSCYTWDGYFDI